MASATNPTVSTSTKIGVPALKEAGVTSVALGLSVAIAAFAVQAAIGAGKSLVVNAKAVLETAKA